MPGWDSLLDVLILLGASLLLGTLAEQLRQNAILGYLLAGTLVGPNMLGFVEEGDHVRAIAELGVALLLFTIGLEFSFRRLRQLGRTALLGGGLQIVITMLVAGAVAVGFGLDVRAATAVGAMVALSSTACVMRVLIDRRVIDATYGRNALGILLMQDLAVIPLVLLVGTLGGAGTLADAALTVGRTAVFAIMLVCAFVLLFNYVLPRVLDIGAWSRNRELPILLAIVLAIGSAIAAHQASLSPALGAFVAGVLLGESPFATQIRADVSSLRTLLVTLFFSSIGMLGSPAWLLEFWPLVLVTVVLIVVGKTFVVWIVLHGLGVPSGNAIASGLCIAQVGEFSFVLAEQAYGDHNIITHNVFMLVVSATILTLFLTPFLVAAAPRTADAVELLRRRFGRAGSARRADAPDAAAAAAAPAVAIIGFGPAGQAVANALYNQHRDRIVVLEMNPRTAAIARGLDLVVHIGDARQRDLLVHAGIENALVVAITVPDPDTTRAIIDMCRHVAPGAAIVARSRYHNRRWELSMAGAREVVDEEENVGLRIAALARRMLHAEES